MKKIIYIYFSIIISFIFLLAPKVILATGTFQLIGSKNQINETVGAENPITINFVYSGNYSGQLGISVVDLNGTSGLPSDLAFGPIIQGVNGVDSVKLAGVPNASGNYNLNLIITDNNGALLTQPFELDINPNPILPFVFLTNFLPDALLNVPYSHIINFTYTGSYPYVKFSSQPYGLEIQPTYTETGSGNGSVYLQFTPKKAGQFIITADGMLSGETITTKDFILNVKGPVAATPITSPVSAQPTVIDKPPVAAIKPPVVTKHPTAKVSNPSPVKSVITEKPVQPATIVQNTQEQQSITTQAQNQPPAQSQQQPEPQTKPKSSNNVFLEIWNFIKNILK